MAQSTVRRFLSSGSSKTFTSSGSVSGSPAGLLTAVGVALTSGSMIATWYNSTGSGTAGTELWTIAACGFQSWSREFAIPLQCPNGLYVSITGAGSAMTAWAK